MKLLLFFALLFIGHTPPKDNPQEVEIYRMIVFQDGDTWVMESAPAKGVDECKVLEHIINEICQKDISIKTSK